MAVKDNMAYVPPSSSNGALYLRPLLFGTGARIGLQPADEYKFLCMVIPVGDYYKGGLAPVDGLVVTDYDRAAPRGVGAVKVAGNYAADLKPNMDGKKRGFPILLYLDSSTQTLIEEVRRRGRERRRREKRGEELCGLCFACVFVSCVFILCSFCCVSIFNVANVVSFSFSPYFSIFVFLPLLLL